MMKRGTSGASQCPVSTSIPKKEKSLSFSSLIICSQQIPTLYPLARYTREPFTYFSAQFFTLDCSSSERVRTTLAGEPRTRDPGGMMVPPMTRAPAPMIERSPMTDPSSTIAPMPMRTSSLTVQAWRMAEWPTVTSSPMWQPKSSAR